MPRIERHPPADAPETLPEMVGMWKESLDISLNGARKRPEVLNQLVLVAMEYAGYLQLSAPDSAELCQALRTGAQAVRALFAVASAGPGEVETPLGEGPPARLRALGPTDVSHALNWRKGFYLAVLVRERETLDLLCRVPGDALRASPTRTDAYAYLFVDALQGYWRSEQDTPARLTRALEETEPARLVIADPDFVLDLIVPEMELLYRVMRGDAAAFNASLATALERHKKYWSHAKRSFAPEGHLAWGPLAMASLAHEQGLAVTVESDYLPPRLWRGECRALSPR
jgi:hypothetical protein